MLSRIFVTIVFSTLALSAQDPGGSTGGTPAIAIFPPPAVAYKEVQQYLGLSDQQVEALRAIQGERDKAVQAFWKQISDKQTELNQLLQSSSTDYSRIGQLMVEINAIQKQQYPGPKEPYRSQALAILNPQQKAKLPTLTDALNLNTPAYQAVALDLLDSPVSVSPPVILAGSDRTGSAVAATPALAVK